jgi:hypothetical protein
MRILLASAALAVVATLSPLGPLGPLGPRPANAGGPAPWCAVVNIGWEEMTSDCSFWSFEACVPHVLAGNRGFCEPNPAFRGPVPRSHRRSGRHRGWR